MTEAVPQEMALAALTEAARGASQLPSELINSAYAIEKAHQFDEGREVPLRLLQKLVEEFVAQSEAGQ
jgi:hypothetical protein